MQSGVSDYYSLMKTREPMFYNGLRDKINAGHIKKPSVQKHLMDMGLIGPDGTILPTRDESIETTRVNRLVVDRQSKMNRLDRREQSRLNHMRKTAHVDEVTYTPQGVFANQAGARPHLAPTPPTRPPGPTYYQRKELEEKRVGFFIITCTYRYLYV